jgi:SAM-dependent methyltransferase
MDTMQRWWSTYFDERFLRIYRPLLPPERTRAEVESLVELLELPRGAAVLDVACGWGRHSLELAAAGLRVTGVDLSEGLLEEARRLATEGGVEIDWVRADMRRLPFANAFHAAVSLFSSLGYFDSDEDDLAVLAGIRNALRPGGRFVLETMHRDLIARDFLERDWWQGPDGERIRVERVFDPVAGVSHEAMYWEDDGGSGEKHFSIRVRSATEWDGLLRAAGLEPLEWFGSWELEPFTHASPRLLVLSRPA